ncbi:MAG: carboxy terminal-processing peptidase [Zoogloea oleivorans]|uniref:carboxy terminal-processing peptidase n=1 Tax=Zoogloea oleivorans TaxID=1552750 RepID=UPI002A35E525|nr:carboxy terminal-processing peptidase [Zoogloea oleivorans]MDY0034583.1 carboxy terminal-processing peptidase [Zoogloea oleivorans]
MKKSLILALLTVAFSTQAISLEPSSTLRLAPTKEQAQTAYLSAQLLGRYHYKTQPLDDALSEKIFDRYLKSLDPERLFFTQSDVDAFSEARTRLDDAIQRGNLAVPFAMFQRYEQRAVERLSTAREQLKQGFDFSQKESYPYARDKAPWPRDDAEARDLWRKRAKNDWLRLKLAGKDDKAIRETLEKRYDNYLARTQRNKSDDVFQIFMNAFAMSIEPHTNYLGRSASDDFDISMRLSLVGIGAVLQERDEYITIRELVAGGPAAKSGKLAVGDRIVGVGQADGSVSDVVGSRVDEVVKLIRGTKDTKVLLDILPAESGPDGKHKLISLVRDKIKLEEQAAKKSVIKVSEGAVQRKVGVITLPTFYEDFEGRRRGDKEFRSASRDVVRLIDELKKEKVDGLLIDLRNNGGGSLREAVELTGLFIDKGPVVQQRRPDGKIGVESDDNAGVAWDGPMAVLINRGSASASEIFAAALQDYGRAPIIGESSFGKGTVQTLINLDEVAKNDKPKFGELKMTVAQFFRVNGGTTQLKGVTPDIRFPSIADPDSYGESSYDNALPWIQIDAATFKPAGNLKDLVPTLQSRHQARIGKDKEFQLLLEDVAEIRRLRETKLISLNETERRKEKETQEARLKAREKGDAKDKLAAIRDDGLQSGERSLAADLAAEKARKDVKDVLLDEAARIVADEAELTNAKPQLAMREKAKAAGQAIR